jgi:hypothetical protein
VLALESTRHNAWVVATQTGKSRIPTNNFSHFGTPAELAVPPREARNFLGAGGFGSLPQQRHAECRSMSRGSSKNFVAH